MYTNPTFDYFSQEPLSSAYILAVDGFKCNPYLLTKWLHFDEENSYIIEDASYSYIADFSYHSADLIQGD